MTRKNFTLLELSVVLLIIVALASFMVSQGIPVVQQSVEWNLNQKMQQIEDAIVGSTSIKDVDGSVIPNGYINDVGALPDLTQSLSFDYQQLLEKIPSTIPDYKGYDLIESGKLFGGWNGPYIQEADFLRLNEIIQLEFVDNAGTDDDYLRIYANGYSDLERIIYWKDLFQKRYITVAGVPEGFLASVTIQYIKDGTLETDTQDISDSAETDVFLPKGVCAFSAEIKTNHTVLDIITELPISPGKYLVSESPDPSYAAFSNQIVNYDGSTYDYTIPTSGTSLYHEDEEKYYLYNGASWVDQTIESTRTSRTIKTIKTDILLELE